MHQIQIEEIDDFVKLKRKQLERKIFLGSCQTRIVKSYLPELFKNGIAFQPNNLFLKQLNNSGLDLRTSKILAFQINSRHKRGLINCKTKKSSKYDEKDDEEDDEEDIEEINGEAQNNKKDERQQKKFRIMYKIFIQYIPINEQTEPEFINSSKAIKGWICSCPSGQK
jgi:hypothetical protein